MQDRKGVRGSAEAPGSRIDGECEFPLGFSFGRSVVAPDYGLRFEGGWFFGRFGAPGIEDRSILAFLVSGGLWRCV